MNMTHLHLISNHIPVLGVAFGLGLLAFALWRNSDELKKAALGVFLLTALLGIPAYLSGEPAEDTAKLLPGISKPLMEQHEDAAAVAFTGICVLGTASLASLIWLRRRAGIPGWFGPLMLAAGLVVSGLMVWTANLGGQIRHSEIRTDGSAPNSNAEHHE